jgi:hypothetical protein
MKNFLRLILLCALGYFAWKYRDKLTGVQGKATTLLTATDKEPIAGLEIAEPTPGFATPNPARHSQADAQRKYPELGNSESAFNKKFLSLYDEAHKMEPNLIAQPDWPITIAERTARQLHSNGQPPTPSPLAAPAKR